MKTSLVTLLLSSILFINSALGLGDPNQFLLNFKDNMKTLLSSGIDSVKSDSLIDSAERVLQGYTTEQKILFLNSLTSELDKASAELNSSSVSNQTLSNFIPGVVTAGVAIFLMVDGKKGLLAAGGLIALVSYYSMNKHFIDSRKEMNQKIVDLKLAIDKNVRSLELELKAKSL